MAPATRGRTIRWARYYDAVAWLVTLGQARAIRQKTVELAQIQPGDVVLEVGCGTGDVALAAKLRTGAAGRVYGTDAAPEMIEVARQKASKAGIEVDFQVDLIENISFPDHTFDVVLSSLMMHHLPNDLKRRGLREIHRVLKPGGHLLVVDFKRPKTLTNHILMALLSHAALHTGVHELPVLLQEAGFRNITAGATNFWLLGFVRGEAA
jgi:demethylmenaquinone methyltransferase/2-methoxy-6-polyprenyl-1,4-benzoquinol methylase/phosphoethanolamine N-methyltransferase